MAIARTHRPLTTAIVAILLRARTVVHRGLITPHLVVTAAVAHRMVAVVVGSMVEAAAVVPTVVAVVEDHTAVVAVAITEIFLT